MMELLDLFAGYIGYNFCSGSKCETDMNLVTVCVDNVEFYKDLST